MQQADVATLISNQTDGLNYAQTKQIEPNVNIVKRTSHVEQ